MRSFYYYIIIDCSRSLCNYFCLSASTLAAAAATATASSSAYRFSSASILALCSASFFA